MIVSLTTNIRNGIASIQSINFLTIIITTLLMLSTAGVWAQSSNSASTIELFSSVTLEQSQSNDTAKSDRIATLRATKAATSVTVVRIQHNLDKQDRAVALNIPNKPTITLDLLREGIWQEIRDSSLAHEFQQEGLPILEYSRETQFYFGLETASRWMRTLCKTVDALQEATERYACSDPSGPHLTMMGRKMKMLAHLLKTRAVQDIFNSRSLHSQLELLCKRPISSTSMPPTSSMMRIIGERYHT